VRRLYRAILPGCKEEPPKKIVIEETIQLFPVAVVRKLYHSLIFAYFAYICYLRLFRVDLVL